MRKLTILLMFFLFSVAQVWAQNRTVTGKVTDENGKAVAGASVIVSGSTKGAITKEDGTFTISVPTNAKTLTITGASMEPQKVTIPISGNVLASVKTSTKDLDEVVVQVPYGTVKKTGFVGSEGTVTAKQIAQQQPVNFTKALDGLVAGVSSSNGGGAPGSSSDLIVRGIGSISNGTGPLYVLNGVVYTGSISALNPDDIESVTILKDAASGALFGSRGANGVVMITTKRGKKGKPQISAKITQGFSNRGIPEYERLNSKQYYEMMWEATKNSLYATGQASGNPITMAQAGQNASQQLTDGSHLVYNAYNVPGDQLVDPTTGKLNSNAKLLWNESWSKALFRTAQRQNVTTSIAGAGDRSDYLMSFGYLNEEGTMINSGFKRYNMRLSMNAEASNWLKAGLNLDGGVTQNTNVINGGTATSNPFYYSQQMGPIYPIYQHNTTTGAYVIDPVSGQPTLDWGVPSQMGSRPYAANSNLVGTLALDDRHSTNLNLNANAYLDIKLAKHFNLKTTLGVNNYNGYGTTFQNGQYGDAANVKGRTTKSNTRQLTYTLNEVLNWSQSFGKNNFSALVGHENYFFQNDYVSGTKTGFTFPGTIELGQATVEEGSNSFQNNHRIEGYFSRLQYDYNNRYIFSGSYRRDGNSRFSSSARQGDFWSIGAGWRISEESFMKKISWINELKLKADYGSLGNEDIGTYYAYQINYLGGFANSGYSGYVPDVYGANPKLTWEKQFGTNFGVDFVLFNKRVQGSIDYFERGSDGMLLDVPNTPSTALVTTPGNVANMKNKGVEIQIGCNVIMKKNFDWRVDVNFTAYKNEVTYLPGNFKNKEAINIPINGLNKLKVGQGVYDFFIREFAGVDAATGDALYYKDVLDAGGKSTGARTVTTSWSAANRYYVGKPLADWSGGITNTFRFRNYELSILTTYSYGGKFYDGNYEGLMHSGSYGTAWHTDILNAWKKPGDVTNVPRVQNGIADQLGTSSRYLFDRSYINIKNISLTYNLPKATANKLHLVGLSVFGNIDNVALFTAKKGIDPQRNFTGTSDATYPPIRTLTFGLNVNL